MAGAGTFWEHVVQASLPVFKICLLGCVGACLAACGVLDQRGRRTLSKLIYFVFTPALTFSKLAPVLTVQHLLLWMPLAINMFFSVGIGLVLGVLLLLVVGAPLWFRKHVVVATALGNAGNLPLVLVVALLRQSGGVIFEEQDVNADLAIAYVAMGIWAATLTHFTVGTQLLKLPDWSSRTSSGTSSSNSDELAVNKGGRAGGYAALQPLAVVRSADSLQRLQQQQEKKVILGQASSQAPPDGLISEPQDNITDGSASEGASAYDVELTVLPAAVDSQKQQPEPGNAYKIFVDSSDALAGTRQHQQSYADVEAGETQKLLSSIGGLHDRHRSSGGGNFTAAKPEGRMNQPLADKSRHYHQQNVLDHTVFSSTRWQRCWRDISAAAVSVGSFLWALTSPPMVGCLVAVAVGMAKPVRDQLFAPEGHLLMLQDCIEMFSECCIPCLLLMMGATLSKGPGKACPPWRVVVGVCGARLLVLPVLGTGWILLAHKTGWLIAPDSMFLLVMLIQNAVPTALNVHTLATLHGNREEEIGALLFWQYLAACLTVPAALMFFLWLLKTPALAV